MCTSLHIKDEVCRLAVLSCFKTRLLQRTPRWSLPTSAWQAIQRLWNRATSWGPTPSHEQGLCTSPLSCHNYTGFMYDSEFSTNSCVLVHYCVHGVGPSYLSELLQHYVRDRRLRRPAAMQLTQHQPRRKVGQASFGVAGPLVWYSLPLSLYTRNRIASSLWFQRPLKNLFVAPGISTFISKNSYILKYTCSISSSICYPACSYNL